MTLTEYLAQTDPEKMPEVILQEGEYQIWNTAGRAPHRFTHVSVPAVNGSYSVNEGQTQLFTQDAFGYPSKRSCFHLPHPVEELTRYERVGDSYNPNINSR
jgi:hypothetical protein